MVFSKSRIKYQWLKDNKAISHRTPFKKNEKWKEVYSYYEKLYKLKIVDNEVRPKVIPTIQCKRVRLVEKCSQCCRYNECDESERKEKIKWM